MCTPVHCTVYASDVSMISRYHSDWKQSWPCSEKLFTVWSTKRPLLSRARRQRWESGSYKSFRHVETLFVLGRNLYLAGLLLVIQGLFTFSQSITSLQGTDFNLILYIRLKYSPFDKSFLD